HWHVNQISRNHKLPACEPFARADKLAACRYEMTTRRSEEGARSCLVKSAQDLHLPSHFRILPARRTSPQQRSGGPPNLGMEVSYCRIPLPEVRPMVWPCQELSWAQSAPQHHAPARWGHVQLSTTREMPAIIEGVVQAMAANGYQ